MKNNKPAWAWTRIKADANGNPRHVAHYLNFVQDLDREEIDRYATAVKRANKLGGRKYHNRSYGGGIVFQAYECELRTIEKRIEELDLVKHGRLEIKSRTLGEVRKLIDKLWTRENGCEFPLRDNNGVTWRVHVPRSNKWDCFCTKHNTLGRTWKTFARFDAKTGE